MPPDDRFWERKGLAEMTGEEWEALCDGCGRCCLVKLEDEDTGAFHATDVHCLLFDSRSCRCTDYPHRQERVHDCVKLDAQNVGALGWMPQSCAYRRMAEGRGLAWWHPLVSGTPDTVVEAGISVQDRTIPETEVAEADLVDRIRKWKQW